MKCIVCKRQNNCHDDAYFNVKFERFFAEEGSKFEDYYVVLCPDCMQNGLYFSPEKNLEISRREIDLAEANKKISELILERDVLKTNVAAEIKRWQDLYKSREELKERLKCEIELNKELRKKEKHLQEVLEKNIELREKLKEVNENYEVKKKQLQWLREKIETQIPDEKELVYYKDLAEKWYQEKMGWRERCLELERREKAREGRERIRRRGEGEREGGGSQVFPKSLIEVRISIFVPEGCIRVDGVDYRVEGEGKEGEKE